MFQEVNTEDFREGYLQKPCGLTLIIFQLGQLVWFWFKEKKKPPQLNTLNYHFIATVEIIWELKGEKSPMHLSLIEVEWSWVIFWFFLAARFVLYTLFFPFICSPCASLILSEWMSSAERWPWPCWLWLSLHIQTGVTGLVLRVRSWFRGREASPSSNVQGWGGQKFRAPRNRYHPPLSPPRNCRKDALKDSISCGGALQRFVCIK